MGDKQKDIRSKIFDLAILFFSWVSIILGIIAMFITAFVYQIINYRPYLLYAIISIIGIIGFRIWVQENVY
ncbi:MAG: hypothetical protein JW776_00145 [Candidatus Lokiarchaeota archaeon]|nr:hypothetical protein [Candidatus Lokiarchaeota archaeon]